MADTTAASAGSEPAVAARRPPAPIRLKRTWAVAGALVAVLLALGAIFELADARVVTEGPLRVPAADSNEDAVQLTPAFEVEGPTTLDITLTRDRADGWLGVACALVEEDSGDVRELMLESEWTTETARGSRGDLEVTARVDRIPTGAWTLRLEPSWDPVREARPGRAEEVLAPPPRASVRVTEGARSPLAFFLALGLILAPALVQTARWSFRRRFGN